MEDEKLGEILISITGLLIIIPSLIFLHSIPEKIAIQSSGFDPQDVTIGPGTATLINNDIKTHRVVSDEWLFNSGNLSPGKSYSYYFNEIRAYHYHDSMNSSMKGSLELPMSTAGE